VVTNDESLDMYIGIGTPLANDTALGTSQSIAPTQRAVQTYADTKIAKSIGTTKGDIIVFTASGTPVRLAVGGTNGHALVVDSAQTEGVKWAAVSGSSSGDFSQQFLMMGG
jgi:hypothetical protein